MQRKNSAPRLNPAAKRFIKNVGQFIDYWGFMRLQGEIWALVFICEEPLTASEAAKLLGVSKASVSLAIKELIEFKVLSLLGDSHQRNLPLVANENLIQVITGVLRFREKQLLSQTIASFEALAAKPSGGLKLDKPRLKKMRELMTQADGLLTTLISLGDANQRLQES